MFFTDLKQKTVFLRKMSLSAEENNLKNINPKSTQALSLIDAIKKNDEKEFFKILALETDNFGKRFIDEVDDFNKTPLYWAANLGYVNFIGPLRIAGASINKQDANGVTSVYIAAYNGHASILTALYEAGANMDIPTNDGFTPVYVAAQNGHVSAIAALHAAKANMNTPNRNGVTPVFIAAQNGHAIAIAALYAAGANIHTATNEGVTPIFIAAQNGHAPTVTVLLEAAADASKIIKISCFFSGTALDKAKQNADHEVMTILEAHFKQHPNGIKPIATINPVDSFSVQSSSPFQQKSHSLMPKPVSCN